jgi:type VI secretion system protein ImpH
MGQPSDPLDFLRSVQAAPYRYDFFGALRRIECSYPQMPRLGEALLPGDEPVRLGQEASLAFAGSTLRRMELPGGAEKPRLTVAFFGLLGPNGPLPLHLTEYARARQIHAGDKTFVRFLDVLHHRFLALFYRAWAQAQPTVQMDRPQTERFSVYLGALAGLAEPAVRERDAIGDPAKLFFTGLLARQVRNRDGLEALLTEYFRIPVAVQEHVGRWMRLEPEDRTRLGQRHAALGRSAIAGDRVWDRQHQCRVRLGPLTLTQYEDFLPGGQALPRLADWMRQYLNMELDWDAQLVLRRDALPRMALGRYGRLGWTSWLGKKRDAGDPDELLLDAERLLSQHAGRRAGRMPDTAVAVANKEKSHG